MFTSTICEECKIKDSIIYDHMTGMLVCTNCGRVHLENETIENNNNEPQQNNLETEQETYLEIKEKDKIKVIKNYPKQTKVSKNLKRIEKLLTLAQVSHNYIETTKNLYNIIAPNKNMQGRNFTHIIIALFFCALRIEKNAKSLKEVAKMFPSVTERQIRKAYNSIKCYIMNNENEEDLYLIERNYIQLYLGDNQEKYEVKLLAYKIIKNINFNGLLEGKSPNTIAGMGLFLAHIFLDEYSDINNKEFFNAFSNRYAIIKSLNEIKGDFDKIIPQKYLDKIEEINEIII